MIQIYLQRSIYEFPYNQNNPGSYPEMADIIFTLIQLSLFHSEPLLILL